MANTLQIIQVISIFTFNFGLGIAGLVYAFTRFRDRPEE